MGGGTIHQLSTCNQRFAGLIIVTFRITGNQHPNQDTTVPGEKQKCNEQFCNRQYLVKVGVYTAQQCSKYKQRISEYDIIKDSI